MFPHTSDIRNQVVELLKSSRNWIRNYLDVTECAHDGMYHSKNGDCIDCDLVNECRWLYSNDEFVDLAQKPLDQLFTALEFAKDRTEAETAFREHAPDCMCDSCAWLRTARDVLAVADRETTGSK